MIPVEVKLDRNLLILYVVLIATAGALLWHGSVKWEQVAAFMSGAIVVPGILGRKKDVP